MTHRFAFCALAALGLHATTQAALYTFDVTGIKSQGTIADARNAVFALPLNAAKVTGIGWDVDLTAYTPSWLTEISVIVDDSSADLSDANFVSPALGEFDSGGPAHFSSGGIRKFADNGDSDVLIGSDGIVRLEFFESLSKDLPNSADGIWNSGTLTLEYTPVPEPASLAVVALGLGCLRRRKNARK